MIWGQSSGWDQGRDLPQFIFLCCSLILIWSGFKFLRSWNTFQHKLYLNSSQVQYKTIEKVFWFLFSGIEEILIESQRKHAKFSTLIYHLHVAESRSNMSNRGFASVWKAKLSCHFHLRNVNSRDSCATFRHVFLLSIQKGKEMETWIN